MQRTLLCVLLMIGTCPIAATARADDETPALRRHHREGPDLDVDAAAGSAVGGDDSLPARRSLMRHHSKAWLRHHPREAAREAAASRGDGSLAPAKKAKKHSKWWLKHHPKEAAAEAEERAGAFGTAPEGALAGLAADKPVKKHSKWWLKHHPREAAAEARALAEAQGAPGEAPPPDAATQAPPFKKHSKWWLKHHPKEAAAERAAAGQGAAAPKGSARVPVTPLLLAVSRHLHVGNWDLTLLASSAETSLNFAALVRVADGADGGNPVCHLILAAGSEEEPKGISSDIRLHACPRAEEADQVLLRPQPLGAVGAWLARVVAGRYERKGRGVEMTQVWTIVAETASGPRIVFEHGATSFKGVADESTDQSEVCSAPTVQFGPTGEPALLRIGCDTQVRRDSYIRPSHHDYEYVWVDGQFNAR